MLCREAPPGPRRSWSPALDDPRAARAGGQGPAGAGRQGRRAGAWVTGAGRAPAAAPSTPEANPPGTRQGPRPASGGGRNLERDAGIHGEAPARSDSGRDRKATEPDPGAEALDRSARPEERLAPRREAPPTGGGETGF